MSEHTSTKITLESIAESIGKLATHEEVRNLATRMEITATREDIKKLPTHDELHHEITKAVSNLPTKHDLGESFDELARMVAVGFRETDKMFVELKTELGDFKDEMGERFSKVDKRFDGVDQRLDRMDVRFDTIESNLQPV